MTSGPEQVDVREWWESTRMEPLGQGSREGFIEEDVSWAAGNIHHAITYWLDIPTWAESWINDNVALLAEAART